MNDERNKITDAHIPKLSGKFTASPLRTLYEAEYCIIEKIKAGESNKDETTFTIIVTTSESAKTFPHFFIPKAYPLNKDLKNPPLPSIIFGKTILYGTVKTITANTANTVAT